MTVALLAAFAGTLVVSTNTAANTQEIYASDQGHTEILFSWSHAGVSMQHAEFDRSSGTLTLFPDKPEDSSVEFTIDVTSLSTGYEALDSKLASSSWLNATEFPEITFQSTSIDVTGDNTAKVTGDLTLHGVTKPVVLDTEMTFRGNHPVGQYIEYYKGPWVAFHATTTIDHQAFGIGAYSMGPIEIEIITEMKAE